MSAGSSTAPSPLRRALRSEELAIEQAPGLDKYADALKALGYLSLEQFLGASATVPGELKEYLGASVDDVVAKLPATSLPIPEAELKTLEPLAYSLGFAVEKFPKAAREGVLPTRPWVAMAEGPELLVAGGPPPDDTSGAPPQPPAQPPLRDQGERGTCVAHAALAAWEHQLVVESAYNDMSEQYLYWNCKANDGYPKSGTWLQVAVPLLQRDGCCLEATWPYVPDVIPGNEGQGPASAAAKREALNHRIRGFQSISPTSVADIRSQLAANRWVAFSVPVFNSWLRNRWVAHTGDIILPVPGEVRAGGHAMCIVGYEELPEAPGLGGGRFILRNSWGTRWGIASPHGTGYGTIPYSYIALYGTEAYSMA